ncbi:trypsin-like peptidase domain-containing protein [Cyanobacteria bacterium FACHB-63]|nr:trypsin-like peptidase domain-containing protein [Cyanobacteria bacterium FACHB-63]
MRSKRLWWSAIVLCAIALTILIHAPSRPMLAQQPTSSRLALEDINELAARTTVVIAQDLQKGQVEAGNAFNPGSGVIVAKVGKVYYVATNFHVVAPKNVPYGVRTFDGAIHIVEPNDPVFGIHRFGKQQPDGTVRGLDLAIIRFESDKDYPPVDIDLNLVDRGIPAYVSGWPQPAAIGQSMSRKFSPGEVLNVRPPSDDGGYGLFYTSNTAIGMSGGPVFNRQGQVIGIHGRGAEIGQASGNQGIQVDNLARQAEQVKHTIQMLNQLQFSTQLPNAAMITAWQTRPLTADEFKDPEAAFKEAFRRSALRFCSPSWVDTGDPADRCSKKP